MNQELILWIIGGLVALLSCILKIVWDEHKSLAKDFHNLDIRVAKIESFVETWGKNLMKVMHRIDNLHSADELFDEYKRRNGELSIEQWARLRDIYMKVIEEGEIKHTRGELVGATGIVAFCEHKLGAFIKERNQDNSALAKKV